METMEQVRGRATPDQEGELFAPNGKKIIGTWEHGYATAYIEGDSFKLTDKGVLDFEYGGYTEVEQFYNSQEIVRRCGQRVFLDEDGNEWLESQLVAALLGKEIPEDNSEAEERVREAAPALLAALELAQAYIRQVHKAVADAIARAKGGDRD